MKVAVVLLAFKANVFVVEGADGVLLTDLLLLPWLQELLHQLILCTGLVDGLLGSGRHDAAVIRRRRRRSWV